MRHSILFVVAVLAITGCNSTRTIQLGPEADFSQANNEAKNRDAVLTFRDGSEMTVSAFSASPDVSTGIASGEDFETWPTDSILQIRIANSSKGALHGLALGVGIGVVGGAILGLAGGDDRHDPDPDCVWFCGVWEFTAEEKATIGAVGLGALGLIMGPITGAMTKATDDYVLIPPPQQYSNVQRR